MRLAVMMTWVIITKGMQSKGIRSEGIEKTLGSTWPVVDSFFRLVSHACPCFLRPSRNP